MFPGPSLDAVLIDSSCVHRDEDHAFLLELFRLPGKLSDAVP